MNPLRGGELGRQAIEHSVQLGAERARAYDDRDGDQGRDQAVLDRRGAAFVPSEAVRKTGREMHSLRPQTQPSGNLGAVVLPDP